MDSPEGKGKKNIFIKTWNRCKSLRDKSLSKSRSWSSSSTKRDIDDDQQKEVVKNPGGYFSVYVGPKKQRFVMKAKSANHPLFRMLLEDAELEYGYSSQGPILLPCEVDLFYKILAEMESEKIGSCSSTPGCGGCTPFSPSRRLKSGNMAKGYSSYSLLTPSPLLKMN